MTAHSKLDQAIALCDAAAEGNSPTYCRVWEENRDQWFWQNPYNPRKFGPFKNARMAENDVRNNGYLPKTER